MKYLYSYEIRQVRDNERSELFILQYIHIYDALYDVQIIAIRGLRKPVQQLF